MLSLGGKADGLSLSLFAWSPILVKNPIHLEMEWSRTEHTLNHAAWLCVLMSPVISFMTLG